METPVQPKVDSNEKGTVPKGRWLLGALSGVATGVRLLLGWTLALVRNSGATLNKCNGVVTAFATVILALITGAYLLEVREQRLLAYRQIALQNRPDVEIGTLAPFESVGLLRTAAALTNRGGMIENVKLGVVIFCCKPVEEAATKPDDLQTLAWGRFTPRLSRDQRRNFYLGITDDQRTWLERALKDKTAARVHAYVRVDYVRPANPIEPEAGYRDSMSFWWNPNFNQWMELSERGNKMMQDIVESRRLFEEAP